MAQQPEQNLSNHTRWDPSYHFVLFTLLMLAVGLSVYMVVQQVTALSLWVLVASITLFLATLKLRVYSLKVQDRVIRLEERLRMQTVLPESQRHQIASLTESQLVALRFASDQELPALVDEAVTKKLDSKTIKQSIKTWRPDYFRV